MLKISKRAMVWTGVLASLTLVAAVFWGSWLLATPFDQGLDGTLATPRAGVLQVASREPSGVEAGALPSLTIARVSADAGSPLRSAVGAVTSTPLIGTHRVLGNTMNVLLLGLDRNPGVRRGGLTDTLIVAALDRARGRLGLVSVPRDLLVEYPGKGRVRINSVYALAKRDKENPLRALGRVLEDTLGIPVRHTIAIDLGVLERVVDVIGGIEVVVPCPIVDSFIDPRVESGRRLLDVPAGRRLMDGSTVAMYVRSRHGRTDWNRSLRQQAVLLGLRERLTHGRTLLRFPELLAQVETSIQTDLSRLDLLTLAREVLAVEHQHLHGLVLGRNEMVPLRTEQHWAVLLGDDQAIEERLTDLFVAPRPGHEPEPCPAADAALHWRQRGFKRNATQDAD